MVSTGAGCRIRGAGWVLGAHQGALGGYNTSLLIEGGSEVLGGDGNTSQAATRGAGEVGGDRWVHLACR